MYRQYRYYSRILRFYLWFNFISVTQKFHWKQKYFKPLPRNINLHKCLQFKFDRIILRYWKEKPSFLNEATLSHSCQMAIVRFLDRVCLALRASGIWLRYATLQNLIPSFPWIAPG